MDQPYRCATRPLPASLRGLPSLAAWAVLACMPGCATAPPTPPEAAASSAREDIFVLRSLRIERNAKSQWCTPERTGFVPFAGGFLFEDHFSMWSLKMRDDLGRIEDAKSRVVGDIRGCFAPSAEPRVLHFYAESRIAGLPLTGNGQCTLGRPDYPEQGIVSVRCHLDLRGLPAPYIGGVLTTNSVVSKQTIGDVSDPPGYVQPSIATIRLWRTQ